MLPRQFRTKVQNEVLGFSPHSSTITLPPEECGLFTDSWAISTKALNPGNDARREIDDPPGGSPAIHFTHCSICSDSPIQRSVRYFPRAELDCGSYRWDND